MYFKNIVAENPASCSHLVGDEGVAAVIAPHPDYCIYETLVMRQIASMLPSLMLIE
jgi:hypothetical protein